MKSITASFLCLALGGCSGIAQQSPTVTSSDATSSGYIPGAGATFPNPEALRVWRQAHHEGIERVEALVTSIKNGQRAPGCIGEDKFTCVASIAQVVPIADDYSLKSDNLFPEEQLDVNGNSLNGGRLVLTAFDSSPYSPTADRKLQFDMRADKSGKIRSMIISLPKDPMFAKTQEQYDRTRLYEAIAAVASKGACPTLTAAGIAQWFENKVKPRAKFSPKEYETTMDNVSVSQERGAKGVSYCGRTFDFHSIQGVDPKLISIDYNASGTYGVRLSTSGKAK